MWCAAVLSLCCPCLASSLSAGVSPSVDLICTNLLPSAEPTGSYSDLLITCLTQNRGIDRIQAHALLNHSKYKKLQLTSCKDIFTVYNSILLRLFLLQLPAHPENFLALKFSLPPLFLHLANLNKNIFCHFHCPLAPEVPGLISCSKASMGPCVGNHLWNWSPKQSPKQVLNKRPAKAASQILTCPVQ